jgi:diguanylate cyclase (GGDEF)-like protein
MEKEMLMEQLAMANAELARLAFFDPLTGLCNRRHFDSLFRDLLTRASMASRPVSLVMVDLDRFKSVNDTYGHATGDAVLRASSAALVAASHDADLKARLGGEELAVVLPDTDAHQALAAAERFREAIARSSVTTHQGPLRVTASFGIATFMGSGARVDLDRLASVLCEVADKALYESKNNGRNRVTIGGVVR